jgi:hypothetical protein
MSCPINIWVSSTNWEQLKTNLDYNDMQFAIEMISNGYCCGVDTWLTFSISAIQNTCKWNFKTLILIFKITIKIFVKCPFHKMNIMCLLKIQGATKKKGWRPYKGKNIGQNCQTLNRSNKLNPMWFTTCLDNQGSGIRWPDLKRKFPHLPSLQWLTESPI